MATDTEIANMTCDFLDLDPIGDLATDRSGHGKALRRNFLPAMETVLSEFPYNCATVRATLNKLTLPAGFTVDDSDHQTAWALPTTCLRVVDINGRPQDKVSYAVETIAIYDGAGVEVYAQKVLWCDEDAVVLRFTRMVPAADLTAHAAKAVALELAQRCVMKAANSTQKMEQLDVLYMRATKGDRRRTGGYQVDSRENRPKLPTAPPSTGARARAGDI